MDRCRHTDSVDRWTKIEQNKLWHHLQSNGTFCAIWLKGAQNGSVEQWNLKLHLWPNRVDPQIHNLGCQHSWEMYSSFEIHFYVLPIQGFERSRFSSCWKCVNSYHPISLRDKKITLFTNVWQEISGSHRSLKEHFAKGLKRLNKTGVSRTLLVSAAVRSRVQWQVDANERTETCLLFETCKHFLSVKF